MSEQTIDQTAELEVLTVEHWRERYSEVRPKFGNLTEVHELLSARDQAFEGINGYHRLRNVQLGKGGLEITAKAVVLLEQNAPAGRPANKSKSQTLGKAKPRKQVKSEAYE